MVKTVVQSSKPKGKKTFPVSKRLENKGQFEKYKSPWAVRELLETRFNDGQSVLEHKDKIIEIIGRDNYIKHKFIPQKLRDMLKKRREVKAAGGLKQYRVDKVQHCIIEAKDDPFLKFLKEKNLPTIPDNNEADYDSDEDIVAEAILDTTASTCAAICIQKVCLCIVRGVITQEQSDQYWAELFFFSDINKVHPLGYLFQYYLKNLKGQVLSQKIKDNFLEMSTWQFGQAKNIFKLITSIPKVLTLRNLTSKMNKDFNAKSPLKVSWAQLFTKYASDIMVESKSKWETWMEYFELGYDRPINVFQMQSERHTQIVVQAKEKLQHFDQQTLFNATLCAIQRFPVESFKFLHVNEQERATREYNSVIDALNTRNFSELNQKYVKNIISRSLRNCIVKDELPVNEVNKVMDFAWNEEDETIDATRA